MTYFTKLRQLLKDKTTSFYTEPKDIQEWLKTYCNIDGAVVIAENGKVKVTGSVTIKEEYVATLTKLKVDFEQVSGSFTLTNCAKLRTLAGCPAYVGVDFCCSGCCALTTLEGGPAEVGRNFQCSVCTGIKNFNGSPLKVGGTFEAFSCIQITTLAGAPLEVGGDLNCLQCTNLKTLDGCPRLVCGNLFCTDCKNLNSLDGITAIKGTMFIPDLPPPNADTVRQMLTNKTEVQLDVMQKSAKSTFWRKLVNDYKTSGDLLPAVTAFEAFYKEPYVILTEKENCPTIADLPTL